MDAAAARTAIALHRWWHTIELAPGVVTPGYWDLRATSRRIPWPASLAGARCLDVGTMDGFWAFELERRGAPEVVATDLVDPAQQDPYGVARPRGRTPPEALRGATFRAAAELLGSRATYRDRNVYDLEPAEDGEFDVVFMGYVLQMVRDPLRALDAVRRVSRGHLLLLETISAPLSLVPAPLARLDARRDGSEFFVFNPRGLRKALALAGFEVEASSGRIRDRAGPGTRSDRPPIGALAMHVGGFRGRSLAVRARALS
jgi:tRNA (mo5U34)-methyltransferase